MRRVSLLYHTLSCRVAGSSAQKWNQVTTDWQLRNLPKVSFPLGLFLGYFVTEVCVHTWIYVLLHLCRYPQRRESTGSPGTGLTGGCEPPGVGPGSWTHILWGISLAPNIFKVYLWWRNGSQKGSTASQGCIAIKHVRGELGFELRILHRIHALSHSSWTQGFVSPFSGPANLRKMLFFFLLPQRDSVLFILIFVFNYMYVCVYECGFVHVSVVSTEDRRGNQFCLELQFQGIVSYLLWVPGTELHSVRAVGTFNCWAISPSSNKTPFFLLLF